MRRTAASAVRRVALLNAAIASDVGVVREENQDRVALVRGIDRNGSPFILAALADGIIRNEYNKMIEFIKFIANEHHPLIVAEVQKVQSQGEDWVQPDWDALLGKASAPATAKTTKTAT